MNQPLATLLADSTILLAEDDDNDAFLIRHTFRKAHLLNPIVHVRDGEEAIAYLKGDGCYSDRERFQLPFMLLLDLKMPRGDGFDVLRWVQTQSQLQGMLSVILTSCTHESDIARAHKLGAHSYLTKPGGFDELIQLMNRLNGSWLMTGVCPDVPCPHEQELEMAH